MSQNRLLFVSDAPLLATWHAEKLKDGGFYVETAKTGEEALEKLDSFNPNVVVVDLVLPQMDGVELIRHIRANPTHSKLPIVALPTALGSLAIAAGQSGANAVLKRDGHPIADVIDAAQVSLGMKRTSAYEKDQPYQPDSKWLNNGLAESSAALATIRGTVHHVVRDQSDRSIMRMLLQQIHTFAEQMAVLDQRSVQHFASSIEALVYDLHRSPEQINASTLRTLGQAADFLATLFDSGNSLPLKEPTASAVLIVDDDAHACQLIGAAMQLVELGAVTAESPTSALAITGAQPFDLIFLDVGLPEMNGFEFCQKVRELPHQEKTPVVFLTGMPTFQNRVQSSLSGGTDFVGKPFNLAELGVKALMWIFRGQLGQT